MKKSKMVMTVIVSLCLVILFIPMNVANAGNGSTTSSVMGSSLAGNILTTSVNNISEDIAGISASDSASKDDTPDTSDRTPIHIISTMAILSLGVMVTVCIKEYVL